MFNDFWFNVQFGINHVLDINGYDHVLFLIVLSVPYVFKDWKRVLILVSVFTVGHSLSLLLAAYDVLQINGSLVEFLIPLTILIVAVYNVFTAGKKNVQSNIVILFVSTLFFGIIHGLGFAREFKMFIGKTERKLVPLLEFALGIEISQIIIVFVAVFLGFLGQTVFRFSKRDWMMVVSAIVIGLVIPMLINSEFIS
ncbi:MAG: HupE/UreJ family protein [Bacteroidia bacterium]|nr:HupE/UreJ family protein [Bacteroidia bacterium]NND24431.1 HupE/UreJ family protein [Flavobacteriaceae bacterium]MBT8279077.1 HupE/UreJ family protein [Bacteroidia bacterium]NNK60449.1 HupE/UreJ family protein [Flavobacteriaceae bacterium]NNL32312.1 HupE/UreJ family protein [Flavobacteriaceae bacterium]